MRFDSLFPGGELCEDLLAGGDAKDVAQDACRDTGDGLQTRTHEAQAGVEGAGLTGEGIQHIGTAVPCAAADGEIK